MGCKRPSREPPIVEVSSCVNWVVYVKFWSLVLVDYLNVVDKDIQLFIKKFTCWKLYGIVDMFMVQTYNFFRHLKLKFYVM